MKTWSVFFVVVMLGFGFAIVVQDAEAIGGFKPQPGELALLPPYCGPRAEGWGNDTDRPEVKQWLLIYGDDWQHMHHLCDGLNYINRSYRKPDLKGRNLSLALLDLGYMERNAKNPQVLAETYLARAVALLGLKRDVEALAALNKAVSLAPESAIPHVRLADYYIDRKQKEQALSVVIEGLRYRPDSKSLQRRYTELGGKLPYPDPYTKPELAPVNTPIETSNEPQSDAGADKPVAKPPAPEGAKSGNPWCRFCP